MKLTDFLIDLGNSVAYYPKLVEVTGGVLPNLFLCQMYYWLGKQKNPEGWIYKTQAEIEKETGLTRKQQETARKFLKARGLLQEKYTGCPRRLEFWLDKDTLNQRWSAFMNNLELPIAKITSSWTRRAKKSQDDADQKPSIMPNSDNIDSTNSAICNALTEQYILPQSSSTECPDSTGYNAFLGHTVMPSLDNLSIYTKNTSKITSEITHNAPLASPPAPPTQECVCEKEELDLTTEEIEIEEPIPEKPSLEESAPEEPTPQQPTSLSKKPESLQQTDNPSRESTIAAGSFDKSEQPKNEPVVPSSEIANLSSRPHLTCYTIHPTEKTEQAMQNTGLPSWMDKAGPNGWKAEFVESYRQYLNSTPRYAKELIRQATTGEAKNALTRLSKTDSGKAEIQNHWDSFNELKERQQHQQQHQPHHSSDDALAKAIADDEERRRFEQQQHSWVPMPQKDAVALKAKLQAAVSSSKVPSNARPSSMNLREVEAQLKLAR
ncbi:Phage DNA replication protein O [Nostoc flagelliforme CCNUN1]|uniref:Phage DNA replication protein O n=1 Tax=Nostoc flagelliforme CCNUN1 TaxID=2038116 RepID=A0A2K8T3V5_9NOSO|nr:hypothetical protein [Nostoc flagelliforme]AUB42300.1 Phage DNA replication protein O [Nostoc flagelliforme CCNUN1]